MKFQTVSILATLESLEVPQQDQGSLLSLATARTIAYRLPIPAAPVANPYQYFVSTYRTQIEAALAELNERVIVNLDAVFGTIAGLWQTRYNVVHDPNNTAVRDLLDGLVRCGTPDVPAPVSELLVRYEASPTLESLARALNVEGVIHGC